MDDDAFLDPVEHLPREALQNLQFERLKNLLDHAYANNGLIRERWDAAGVKPDDIRSLDDFGTIAPFITKQDIRDFRDGHGDPFGGLLCADVSSLGFIASTSGTTGDATLFASQWTGDDLSSGGAAGFVDGAPSALFGGAERDLWHMGARPGDYVVFASSRIRGPVFSAAQRIGAVPIMLGFGLEDSLNFVALSRQYRPKVLYTASTPLLLALLEAEKLLKVDMREVLSSYTGIIFAGEPMRARTRATFERWGVADRIFEQSSFGDIGVANGCRVQDGLHVWEDTGILEVVDVQTGEPVPEGEVGELVATSLVNGVDPLIRFRSGDLVKVSTDPCACGRTHARLWVRGRTGDGVKIGDQTVLPLDVWDAVSSFDETSAGLFQIVAASPEQSALVLRVGFAGEPDLEDLASRIAAKVNAEIGLSPIVELVPDAELLKQGPPHKIPRMTKR